ITMAESFGVEDRGHFYDPVGALRDVVVNHLMPVVAATTMELPTGDDAETLKDSIHGVFRAMEDADPAHYVRGQYDGYRDIEGVAADSSTETYAAMRLEIDNWRWAGVPFFIRTGKCLPVTQTELRVLFRHPPRLHFRALGSRAPEPNQLVVKLDPSTGVRLEVEAKRGDRPEAEQIYLEMEFAEEGGEGATPYEVLLHAAMVGDSTRFTRQDNVEEAWRVLQPLLDNPPPVHPYAKGSWGPEEANQLVAGAGGWPGPWVASGARPSRGGQPQPRATPRRPPSCRARPCRRRSPRSPTTPSCPTATPGRWWRPTGRSTGCACRRSTRRACSAACSTGRPAPSGWARSASTSPVRGPTSPGRTSW